MPIKKKKISELPLAESLVGLFTIGVDSLNRSVKVGLEFVKNAATNASSAAAAANTAAANADAATREAVSAADTATTAAGTATVAASSANTAAANANAAKEAANTAATTAGNAATNANAAKEAANTAATNAQAAASSANTAAANADAATALALAATEAAQDTADHPTYVGQDFYVYKWNASTAAYDKTDIYVKGEGFSIEKIYASISQMNADYNNASIKVGQFVMVNTSDTEHPDNAKLYVKGSAAFEFVVDMSGAIGFTGKTPQLAAGTTATLPPGTAAAVSLSEDGQDEAGNPRYKINFSIPRGDEGKPLIVLSNGNFGNWNEQTGEYEDSGVVAAATVDLANVPVDFTEAANRTLPETGDTVPAVFGKLLKWLSGLKALAFKDKANYAADIDNLPRLGQVIYRAENKTTAAATATKVLTVDEGYTPVAGDLVQVTWTIGNSVANPTFSINGTVYPVWFNGFSLSQSNQYSNIAANSVILYFFDGGKFHQIGSNLRAQAETGVIITTMGFKMGAEAIPAHRFLMEGADGNFYSLVTGSTSNTNATKPVATVEFKLYGQMMYSTNAIAAGAVSTSTVYLQNISAGNWYNYALNGTSHLGLNRMCYLKGRVNEAGNFVLDNTSFTSFYTTDIPTTDDGFVYVEFIWIGAANTRMHMKAAHPAFWFKDGKFRPYGEREVMPVKHKTATIAAASWTGETAPFTIAVTDADIVDGCFVTVFPVEASQDAADQASIYSEIQTAAGSFIIKAKKKPTEEITIKYTIQR